MTLEQINEILKNQYGTALTGPQRFRVVDRDAEFEKRRAEFEDYHNDIFIRRVYETRLVLKYPFAASGSYVLERYTAEPFGNKWPAMPSLPEVVEWNGYEPFYVFDADTVKIKGIPPIRAVLFIIQTNIFKKEVKQTLADMAALDEAKLEKEKAEFLEMMDDASPWVATALHEGEGVVVPDMKHTKDTIQ